MSQVLDYSRPLSQTWSIFATQLVMPVGHQHPLKGHSTLGEPSFKKCIDSAVAPPNFVSFTGPARITLVCFVDGFLITRGRDLIDAKNMT